MRGRLRTLADRLALPLVALALAFALKRFYSDASAEQLRWILLPTSWLTSLGVDTEFTFRAGEGYLSRERAVLISPACAGVNFLVIAFVSLVLAFGARFAGMRQRAQWLLVSAAGAYLATLLVNALRISLSIALSHLAMRLLGLTFHSVHRLIGMLVYLSGLMSLCLTVQVWLTSRERSAEAKASRVLSPLLVALGCYAAVTLLVPLARGGSRHPDFWQHAAPVSVLVGGVSALLFAARGRNWDDGRHEFRSPEHPDRVAPEPSPRS